MYIVFFPVNVRNVCSNIFDGNRFFFVCIFSFGCILCDVLSIVHLLLISVFHYSNVIAILTYFLFIFPPVDTTDVIEDEKIKG